MGLLEKANHILARDKSPASLSLDEKGLAYRDRLRRLSRNRASPYTALSLLKWYCAFHAGICFSRKNNFYHSYSTVGTGLGNISVPEEMFLSVPDAAKKYFRLETSSLHLGIHALSPSLELWIFPLDRNTPWDAVLLLAVDKTSSFNPENISLFLDEIPDIINPQKSILKTDLRSYHTDNPFFSVILTVAPKNMTGEEENYFLEKLKRMVSLAGKVIPLSKDNASKNIVLIPQSADRRLIAHRLDATLPVEIPLAFDAESPDEALEKLKPFLL